MSLEHRDIVTRTEAGGRLDLPTEQALSAWAEQSDGAGHEDDRTDQVVHRDRHRDGRRDRLHAADRRADRRDL